MKCSTCGKMNCYAHGGSVDEGPSEKANQSGVHKIVPNYDRKHNEVKHGQSEARYGDKKAEHGRVLGELRAMPKPKLKGLAKGGVAGKDGTDMYAMKPDVPAMHGMDEGGEMDDNSGIDDELNDMVADEAFEAFEKKDKKAFVEAIKALVMNCGGK